MTVISALAKARLTACALGSGALALAAVLGWRGSNQPDFIGHHSLATFAATVFAGTVGLLAVVAALAPARWWMHAETIARRLRSAPLPHATVQRWHLLAIANAVALHLLLAGRLAQQNDFARDDQNDYMLAALKAVEFHDGPIWMWPALYAGELREDNRHPLYVMLLAFNHRSFAFGKLVSLVFGVATVWVLGESVARRFGGGAGVLAAFLLATNAAWLEASSLVACETLLTLLIFTAWLRIADDRVHPYADALALGGWFALAYLTKASAAFLLFVWIGWRLARRCSPIGLVCTVFAFLMVASPLLTRNVIAYGNPLHSFNNKLLFAESYESGRAEPDLGTVGNWRRFRDRHTWKEIVVDRLAGGVGWESFVLLRLLGPYPLGSSRAVFGAVVLLLAAVGWWSVGGRRLAPAFTLLALAWFVLFFGWYQPIASGDRFLLPLAPPVLAAAAVGAVRLCKIDVNSFVERVSV